MRLTRTPSKLLGTLQLLLTPEEGKRPEDNRDHRPTTATSLKDKMSDKEGGTPNPAKTVKFANPGQAGALFPQLQSRCSVQKGLLTKGLNSLMKTSDEFSLASEEGSALTIKRKAEIFLDKVSAVSARKSQLEDAFDKLVEHTYELNDTDFEPLTAPQVMAEPKQTNVRAAQPS